MSPSIQSKYWRIFKVDGGIFDYEEGRIIPALFWCLPSVAGKHGLLKETGVASTRAKAIRVARALLAAAGPEGLIGSCFLES